jgi:hypothetical protein
MRILSILLILLLLCCSEEPKKIPEPAEKIPEREAFKYRTYKRVTGLSNIESDLLKKHSDLDGVSREILNIYDNSKGVPPSSSNSQE